MSIRRNLLKMLPLLGSAGYFNPMLASGTGREKTASHIGVHPFVENHPEAVFVMRTHVDVKTHGAAIKNAGFDFGRSVFVSRKKGKGSFPVNHTIVVKPNMTCSFPGRKRFFFGKSKFPLDYGMGIITDPYFVEGTIESIKQLGMAGKQFYIREVNCPKDFGPRGYTAMAQRTEADLRNLEKEIGKISENDINWVDIPNGWIHKKIPYLWPVNTPDSWLLNIAKFKAHGMGLTLCCKNHQGSIAHNYQQYCGGMWALGKIKKEFLVREYKDTCKTNHARHIALGIPRWDKPGLLLDGFNMDVWATRTLDNLSVSPMGLCVIEGIYGRDGNGFLKGPNKGRYDDNEAWDYMTNIIIFGKNPFRVDIIGHWLGGHEPGNLGFFHLAMERGMLNVLNPMDIPVYLWKEDGTAALMPLDNFQRTPLITRYLPRENEPYYHMLDEPFDYSTIKTERAALPQQPDVSLLNMKRSNSGSQCIPIEYAVPQNGYARLELLNEKNRLLDVLVDGYHQRGYHMAVWDNTACNNGTYYYRLRFRDFTETKNIVL